MKKYLKQVKDRVNDLQVKFVQIPRKENEHASHLAKTSSTKQCSSLVGGKEGWIDDGGLGVKGRDC